MAPKSKEVVSTSGIFKNHRNRKAPDKPASRKPRHHQQEPSFEHTIAQQFSQCIERSRDVILEEALGSIDSAHCGLINEIAASERNLSRKKDELSGFCKTLTKPLSEDILTFEDKNRTYEVSLGKRMDYFSDKSTKIEQNLAGLWKEWEAIQDQIVGLGEELLGPQGIDVGPSTVPSPLDKECERISQVLATEKLKLGEEIEALCREAIQRMNDNETNLYIATKKKKDDLVQRLLAI